MQANHSKASGSGTGLPSLTREQILSFRLQSHNLTGISPSDIPDAFGGWIMQNSPPGAWELSVYSRMPDITLSALDEALSESRTLIQAWSLRGAPCIFPTRDCDVFLTALIPEKEPWIYTRGIALVLEHLHMSMDELLPLVEKAALILDKKKIVGKPSLDHILAEEVSEALDSEKKELWYSPSFFAPGQTMGEAAVSFLLRPCSFEKLVVFGRREKNLPTFTSLRSWSPSAFEPDRRAPSPTAMLVKRFLHSYGPASPVMLADTLGCSPAQAKRIWKDAERLYPIIPVLSGKKTAFILEEDLPSFMAPDSSLTDGDTSFTILPPHDPCLDIRDRELLLPDKQLQKQVWKTVGNPGVILRGGMIAGTWRSVRKNGSLSAGLSLWFPPSAAHKERMERWFEGFATLYGLKLKEMKVSNSSDLSELL